MFGNFWSNVVILVNFWSFNPIHVQVFLILLFGLRESRIKIIYVTKQYSSIKQKAYIDRSDKNNKKTLLSIFDFDA